MARTNKRWIAAKKAQQQKQAQRLRWSRRFDYPKRKLELEEAKELWVVWVFKNPKWSEYNRFIRWRKICRETRLRVDQMDTDTLEPLPVVQKWCKYQLLVG